MTDARDELADLIRENVWNVRGLGIEGEREGWLWESRFGDAPLPEAVADAILAAGWRAPTTCRHVWEHGWADTEKECQCCHEREPID